MTDTELVELVEALLAEVRCEVERLREQVEEQALTVSGKAWLRWVSGELALLT